MDSCIIEKDPHQDGRDDIEDVPLFSKFVQQDDEKDDKERQAEKDEIDFPAVEQSHDKDGYQVVGHGQGGEEDLQGHGNLVSEHREDADGEGYVGRSGDSPTAGPGSAVVDECEDQGRGANASERSYDGKDGLLGFAEFPMVDFAPDFQSDYEKENHHQDIVDEGIHRHSLREGEVESVRRGDVDGQGGIEDAVIEVPCGRDVGQEQGYQHAAQQDRSLGPGQMGELGPSVFEIADAFIPGIYRKQSHIFICSYLPYKYLYCSGVRES